MTSLFHESEDQLAKLGMAATPGENLQVVMGGLGLGYSAAVALEDPRIERLDVIEFLEGVIDWHRKELVPMSAKLNADPRCQIVHKDFFAWAEGPPDEKYDAVLLDIDHTPQWVLRDSNREFYLEVGLKKMSAHIKPGGIFALWADGRPDVGFVDHLNLVFTSTNGHLVEFDNPVSGGTSVGTVYVCKVP